VEFEQGQVILRKSPAAPAAPVRDDPFGPLEEWHSAADEKA